MVKGIEKSSVKADQICDYIPLTSTACNLVNIFQKCTILFMDESKVAKSPYYTYLQQKSFSRCVLLLIPFIGNFFVGIYDLVNDDQQHYAFSAVFAAKGNKELMLSYIQNYSWAFKYASKDLKEDPDIMLAAIKKNGMALKYASDKFKKDPAMVIAAIQNSAGIAYVFANTDIKGNADVVAAAIWENPSAAFAFR